MSDELILYLTGKETSKQTYILLCFYYADKDASEMKDTEPFQWHFTSGRSAGVYVDDGLFYEADTSDLSQPFSDAFVTFHIADYGIEGSGVVPYLQKNNLILFKM